MYGSCKPNHGLSEATVVAASNIMGSLGFSHLVQEPVAIFPVNLLYSLTFSSSASFLSYSDHVMRLEIRCQAYHDSPTLLWDGMAAFDSYGRP